MTRHDEVSFSQGRKILSSYDQKTHVIGQHRKLLLEEKVFDIRSYVEFIFQNHFCEVYSINQSESHFNISEKE